MQRIGIVGGGFSGFVAAIYAAQEGNDVTILERNNEPLKKILLTGNGKCNFFNGYQELSNYNSLNKELLKDVITNDNLNELMNFYDKIGIIPKIKNNYYYPTSNSSVSIKEALIKEAKNNNVKIITNCLVSEIKKDKNKFYVTNGIDSYIFDKLIISTGSKCYPKTGSDGMGYIFAKKFSHTIVEVLPALTGLIGADTYYKDWAGIRTDVEITLCENELEQKKECGEIQLTNYGISGICVFNLSSIIKRGISKNKKEFVKINFLPFISDDIYLWLDKRNEKMSNRSIVELLEGVLNYKLVKLILKQSNIKEDCEWNKLSVPLKKVLIDNLVAFPFLVKDTKGFEDAQVCSGGIPLSEINILNMESKKCKNLYIIGELLDVDGLCGGYNLTFAFISGMLAGRGIND